MSVAQKNVNTSIVSNEFNVLYLTHLNENKIYLYTAQANVSREHPVSSNFNTSSLNRYDLQNNTSKEVTELENKV
jgi:hypothetical protein